MLKRHLTKETFEKILRNGLMMEEEETGNFKLFRRKEKDKDNES